MHNKETKHNMKEGSKSMDQKRPPWFSGNGRNPSRRRTRELQRHNRNALKKAQEKRNKYKKQKSIMKKILWHE